MSTISRRKVLGGIAATAVVAGWSSATQSWAYAGTTEDIAQLPPLDGTLETSAKARSGFGHDFGYLVSGDPWAVLRPRSVDDIVAIVKYARRNKLQIAVNGQSGGGEDRESHSSFGQALVPGGIAIDSRGLSKIIDISDTKAVVEAGVSWAELTDAALEQGLTPTALTDYLHLSIGGTLSVGGLGGTLHRYGLQVDTVSSIDIVTGIGRLVTVSRSSGRELFEAALSGGGQCGIIVRATIDLEPAPEKARVFGIYYRDLEAFLSDQRKIMEEDRFDAQAGELIIDPDGDGWKYKIDGIAYYSGNAAPDQTALLEGLGDDRDALEVADMSYRDYAFRLDPYEEILRETGHWEQQKPWLSVFLPASKTQEFLEIVQQEISASDVGQGFMLCYPYPTAKSTRPLVAQPEEEVAFLFDLLRFPDPGDLDTHSMLKQNRRLYDKAVSLGGKRYLVGAIPVMTQHDWKKHFGREWKSFKSAKRKYDPLSMLTPGPAIFD